MGPEWLQQIPESVKTVLVGAGGSFLGGLANDAAEVLLGEVRQKVAKKFRADAEREQFNLALARAKYEAVALLTGDPGTMADLLRILAAWMEQEAVSEQLGRLVDPYPDSDIDMARLQDALAESDLAPRLSETGKAAQEIVRTFIRTFSREIEESEALGRHLDTRLLRAIDAKLGAIKEAVVPDLEKIERLYLERICTETKSLNLRGLLEEASDATACRADAPQLADIYIQLDTTVQMEREVEKRGDRPMLPEDRSEKESEPLPVIGALAAHRQMVLLGDPGSGKSTFVNHLSLCLAAHRLSPSAGWLKHLPGWPAPWAGLLPVPVELRAFAAWIRETSPKKAKAGLLAAYLAYWLGLRDLSDAMPLIRDRLRAGGAVLLLDGLDEIQATGKDLETIKNCIEDLPKAYGGKIPILVACRVLSYQDARWRLGKYWPSFELAKLSREKIRRFIKAWYAETGPGRERSAGADRLVQAASHKDLAQLVRIPLLLTMMAVVNDHKGGLPDTRAILYEEIVDLLLKRWDAARFGEGESGGKSWRDLVDQAGVKDNDIKNVLWEVAYATHAQAREGKENDKDATADIPEAFLVNKFRELHPDYPKNPESHQALGWAHDLCRLIKVRAGLLLENPAGVYRFPHRTFQEYLAGCQLGSENFVDRALDLCRQDGFWWNAILLAIGRMVHMSNQIDLPLDLADRLCPEAENGAGRIPEALARDTWFAGQCLMEVGPERVRQRRPNSRITEEIRRGLKRLVNAGALAPVERADAGKMLGVLGDDRYGVGCFEDGTPEIDWRRVEPGPFYMGSDKGKDKEAYSDERPGFQCWLIKEGYEISRYPVTVAQYRPFVDEGGYDHQDCWTPDGWNWRQKNNIEGPKTYPDVFQTPNHPQVGVSWYEAVAYCRWLSQKSNREILLPTEVQWERAARHTDGRIYPWDGELDPDKCNFNETGIGSTSAVGLFPQGNAECGAADMAGMFGNGAGRFGGKTTKIMNRRSSMICRQMVLVWFAAARSPPLPSRRALCLPRPLPPGRPGRLHRVSGSLPGL